MGPIDPNSIAHTVYSQLDKYDRIGDKYMAFAFRQHRHTFCLVLINIILFIS